MNEFNQIEKNGKNIGKITNVLRLLMVVKRNLIIF